MNIIKRDGSEQVFDENKIRNAITLASQETVTDKPMGADDIETCVRKVVYACTHAGHTVSVEEVQDYCENALMRMNEFDVARHYIKYRYEKMLQRMDHETDDKILSVVEGRSEVAKVENSNKNPILASTQRDYIAGTVSRDITNRRLLPPDIAKAHKEGIIHFHDADYFLSPITNCELINLDDMLQNGTMIGQTLIEKPHTFSTACNVALQISTAVASSTYGGQTWSLTALAKFVDVTRQKARSELRQEMEDAGITLTKEQEDKVVEDRVHDDIVRGVQTIQYQTITMSSTNGQAPFLSVCMYLNEADTPELKHDLAMVIEEVLKQRYQGVKNEKGVWVTPAFPKLLYFLEDDNIKEGQPYYYLTQLAAKCTAKRMVPDYISEKIMKKLKLSKGETEGNGDAYPCMGAARGEETVSIRVYETEYDEIPIKNAFRIIRDAMRASDHNDPATPELSEFRNKCGVYKVTHIPTGLYYIGSSTNIARRLSEHRYSCAHKGTLGDNYFIDDYDTTHLEFTLLEECAIDDLYKTESKYVHFKDKDPNCINQKDPINNGNFTSDNHIAALNGIGYSTYQNKWHGTWFKAVPDMSGIYIRSHGEWIPVRGILYNNEKCPLRQFAITYSNSNGDYRTIHVTEDHPFETQRGRTFTRDLTLDDKLIDANTYEYVQIKDIQEISSNVRTYDFTVDNDMFDMSGVISHNCRSFLTPDRSGNGWNNIANAKNYDGKPKYYGRFNQGVVTINLPDVALSSKGDMDEFWKIFDERLELCHRALRLRHERLLGTPSDVAPILWQYGAMARLKKGETIDKLLYGGYSTISLGYAGLYECVKYMTGKSHTSDEGHDFGIAVMQRMNDKCAEWKAAEDIDYSVYGTPIESTTYKFAKCLQRRFGIIPGVTDHTYITNSYHVNVREKIDAFTKLGFESEFQQLSPGGAVSYVEVPNMQDNLEAVMSVIQFIYDNIMYAELNTKSDYCQVCGYDGEIKIVEDDNGKLVWECPNCGNRDQSKMNVTRRTCGYLGSNFWCAGRTAEIKDRVLHL